MILGQYKYIMQNVLLQFPLKLSPSPFITPVSFLHLSLHNSLSISCCLISYFNLLYLIAVGLQTKSMFQTLRVSYYISILKHSTGDISINT